LPATIALSTIAFDDNKTHIYSAIYLVVPAEKLTAL